MAGASGDSAGMVWVAIAEVSALVAMGRFQDASEVGLRELHAARQAGLGAWFQTTILTVSVHDALVAPGHTAQAAALIDPLTTGPPDRDSWILHDCRAEIDLLRGDLEAATQRRELVRASTGQGSIEFARGTGELTAELALWAGRPGDAVEEVRRVLALHTSADVTIFCGRLLATGMRACADLAEQARARQDEPAATAALASADGLASWVDEQAGAPFTDHPSEARIPGDRASWDAERTRLAGTSDPDAWTAAAKAWDDLGRPHNAGYAWWRQAQAQLDAGQPATLAAATLRAAAAAADGHAPLQAQIRRPCGKSPHPAPGTSHRHRPRTGRPALALWAHRPRARGAAPAGGRAHQRADRRRTVHQSENGQRARHQHFPQARRVRPGPGRRPG